MRESPSERIASQAIGVLALVTLLALAAWIAVVCSGCRILIPHTPFAVTIGIEAYRARVDSEPLRRAVVVGLKNVHPAAYDGWSGACPGADVDAAVFADLCREQGLQVAQYHDNTATRGTLENAVRAATEGMVPGDLLVVFYSGHGGTTEDLDGDEASGWDSTLCLWDGPIVDDDLGRLWQSIPAGVRVFFVTDSCHSGTNYRARPVSLRKALPRTYSGSLIHIGGCADSEYSYGSAQGGWLTTALVDSWREGISYRAWFDGAARRMNPKQRPVYAEWGNVTDQFRDGRALQ